MELELDLDLASQEQEPSIVEWARAQGICVDYKTEPLYTSQFQAPFHDEFDRHLHDPSNATITTAVSALLKEKLVVNKDAALLLKAVHSLQEVPATQSPAIETQIWIRHLKQELPVLKSAHELDFLNFGNTAVPDFKDLRIPSEIVVEQSDEGFEWPLKYFAYPAQCDARVKAEKLAVSREVLVYLQGALRDGYVPEDGEEIETESFRHRQHSIVRPITPPLLPLSPPLTPYIPSSPTNHLPLASDSSDSLTVEAQLLHNKIIAADSLLRRESGSSDSMLLDITHPPNFSPLFEVSTLPISKRRAEDLKVEGPLTPPMFSTSPMKKLKSVSFANTLHEYIPFEPWDQDVLVGQNDKSSVESNQFFQDIEPLAEQARKKIENEQLSGADTIARVETPHVDFSLPMAPWNEYSQQKGGNNRSGETELQAQMKFILRTKREDLRSATSWHGLSVPERELKWGFLNTKVPTLRIEEKLHGEFEMNKIISEVQTGTVATSSAQVWKREGLRILDEGDEEEDLDAEEGQEWRDMENLIRKRKLGMEEEAEKKYRRRRSLQQTTYPQVHSYSQTQDGHHSRKSGSTQNQTPKTRSSTMDHNSLKRQARKSASEDLMFGEFSATTALHKFMKTRGKPVKSVKDSRSKEPDLKDNARAGTHISPVQPRVSSSDQPTVQQQQAHTVIKPLPTLPAVQSNLAPCSFVISSTFVQQRGLLKQIEGIYPNAEIVYRDYTLPHSVAEEADITLSPSTGLIFTTLQQIKQRALPGQPDRSLVKERMHMLQLRYERLVVLVSEGLSREVEALGSSRPDDPRDTEALIALEEFASKIEGEVVIQFVRGGERALARSTVVEMAKYGLPYGSVDIGDIKPMAQETSWEVFLRRVGFNPFAAQAIMAWLQKPLNVPIAPPPSSASHFPPYQAQTVPAGGLPRFILMGEEERIRSFQALMGGGRVLTRASKMMDQVWVSAAHGFRM